MSKSYLKITVKAHCKYSFIIQYCYYMNNFQIIYDTLIMVEHHVDATKNTTVNRELTNCKFIKKKMKKTHQCPGGGRVRGSRAS